MTPSDLDALRIVCTKCVRIVRIRYREFIFDGEDILVATECCERVMGTIDGERIRRGGPSALTALTVSHIHPIPISELATYASRQEELSATHQQRAAAARWTAEGAR